MATATSDGQQVRRLGGLVGPDHNPSVQTSLQALFALKISSGCAGRKQGPDYKNVQRNLALELVRVTEAAALAGGKWYGKGDQNAADQVSQRHFQ